MENFLLTLSAKCKSVVFVVIVLLGMYIVLQWKISPITHTPLPPSPRVNNSALIPCIQPTPHLSTKNPKPLLPQKPRKVDGIERTEVERHNEAVGILSLALENAVGRHARLKDIDRNCDWTDGSWVKDTSIAYGKGILSGYPKCRVDYRQNCMRINTKAPYLGYRWVLKNESCEAKRIRFTRERFLETVRDKKIAFIGDSLTRNMFQSLACLLYVPGDKSKMIEDHVYHYRYPDFGVTLEFIVSNYLIKQTSTLCDSDATVKLAKKPCLDIKNVDTKWASRAKEFDILIFATGGWWEHDVQMRQVSTEQGASYRQSRNILYQSLRTVMDYLGRPEFNNKVLYWRCSEVSHFFGGEWNTGGKCNWNIPSNDSLYNAVSLFIEEAVVHSLATTKANISLLDVTKISSYRQDAHPNSQSPTSGRTDCKHWCLPGVPDHWNEIWMNMLNKSLRKS